LKLGTFLMVAAVCAMLSASPVFALSSSSASSTTGGSQSQPLSLTLLGVITDAGRQTYSFSGGQVVQGSIFGAPVSQTAADFHLDATVSGLSVSGSGSVSLGSSQGGGWGSGHQSSSNGAFSAQITINGGVPAAIFPIQLSADGSSFTNCDPSHAACNSEIPLLFTGVATIQSGGHGSQVPIAVESPYWNPFGGPILITSLDGTSTSPPSVFLVVSYTSATILWSGVQLQGLLGGTFGTEPVSGAYGQGVSSYEDLMSGNEWDVGTIAFVGMSDSTLNSQGGFLGHTAFSTAGSFDCAPEFGLPEGTCTATGATSSGSFWMLGSHLSYITGSYNTVWSVPSLFTQTMVMATVIQH